MDLSEFRKIAYEQYYTTHHAASELDRADDPRALAWRARSFQRSFGDLLQELPQGARIVDLGCGTGQVVWWLRTLSFAAHGVDASQEQLAEAARIVPSECLHACEALEYLRNHVRSLDAVFSLNTLEHLTRPEALEFLLATRDALRPGGLLVLCVPNACALGAMHVRYYDITHEECYSENSMEQLLRVAGFESVRCDPWCSGMPAPFYGAVRLLKRALEAWHKLKLIVLGMPVPRVLSCVLTASARAPREA